MAKKQTIIFMHTQTSCLSCASVDSHIKTIGGGRVSCETRNRWQHPRQSTLDRCAPSRAWCCSRLCERRESDSVPFLIHLRYHWLYSLQKSHRSAPPLERPVISDEQHTILAILQVALFVITIFSLNVCCEHCSLLHQLLIEFGIGSSR